MIRLPWRSFGNHQASPIVYKCYKEDVYAKKCKFTALITNMRVCFAGGKCHVSVVSGWKLSGRRNAFWWIDLHVVVNLLWDKTYFWGYGKGNHMCTIPSGLLERVCSSTYDENHVKITKELFPLSAKTIFYELLIRQVFSNDSRERNEICSHFAYNRCLIWISMTRLLSDNNSSLKLVNRQWTCYRLPPFSKWHESSFNIRANRFDELSLNWVENYKIFFASPDTFVYTHVCFFSFGSRRCRRNLN